MRCECGRFVGVGRHYTRYAWRLEGVMLSPQGVTPGAPYFIKGGVIVVDVGYVEGQKIYTELINRRKLTEVVDILLEKTTGEWWPLLSELCFVDIMAVLAIVVSSYGEFKRQELRAKVLEIKLLPTDNEDYKIVWGLLKSLPVCPELYLKLIHKEFGELPLSELEVLAKSLRKTANSMKKPDDFNAGITPLPRWLEAL